MGGWARQGGQPPPPYAWEPPAGGPCTRPAARPGATCVQPTRQRLPGLLGPLLNVITMRGQRVCCPVLTHVPAALLLSHGAEAVLSRCSTAAGWLQVRPAFSSATTLSSKPIFCIIPSALQ